MSSQQQQPPRIPQGDDSRPSQQAQRLESARTQSTKYSNAPSIETSNAAATSRPSLPSPISARVFRVPESPRLAPGDNNHVAGQKVAIPRLKRSIDATGESSARPGGRHRVNHACEPCRHRKTKCSGERPVCRHCQDFKITCYYADGKRDRVKKQFGSMSEKVADYEKLLRDLSNRVGESDAKLIKASLDRQAFVEPEDTATDTATIPSIESVPEAEESGAESEASAGAGSTGDLDRTDEDFTREEARDTGFMGKNSEVTWLQRLRQENKFGDMTDMLDHGRIPIPQQSQPASNTSNKQAVQDIPLSEMDAGFSVQESSYHLDDLPIATFDAVDAYEYPTFETAEHLFNAYMTRVHPSFPIVGRVNLSAQFKKFASGQVQRPPEKWLAIINMIFAIGAKYSHLIQADWKGDERDHLIYFTRARILGMNGDSIYTHPDLQSIQILGLMSFYFLCTSQVNRSWTMAGMAIRWATALGMNMRSDSTALRESLKEIRYRVWWALYSLEHQLCSTTGRINCIMDDHCTTPLPAPVEENQFGTEDGKKLLSKERQQGDRAPSQNSHPPSHSGSSASERSRSATAAKRDPSRSPSQLNQPPLLEWAKDITPNTSLYFLHLIQLTRLTQNIFMKLYNPTSVQGQPWSEVQDLIESLNERVETWYRGLPAVFDFKRKQRDREFFEFRMNLGFFYCGTKIMVHRPCLCRLDRKIPHQSPKSSEFNRRAAMACIEAAKDMLLLIPDEPNAVGLIRVGPWWSILHWLVQAACVLTLEISFRAYHMPDEADSILEASKKAVRWLHALGEDNLAAKRAWGLCNSMLRESVTRIGRDVSDLPSQPPGQAASSSNHSNSSMTGVYQTPTTNNEQFQTNFAQQMYPSATSASTNMGTYPIYQTLDQLINYGQYSQWDQSMGDSLSYSQPIDPNIDFINTAYHDPESQTDQLHTSPNRRFN